MAEADKHKIFFDPNEHPEHTLKAFEEFVQTFELRYSTQYPDPPMVSMDAAIERWKVANTSADNPHPKSNLEQYDQIRDEWRSKDKVAKLLGMFSSDRLYSDWKSIEADEKIRQNITWQKFTQRMKEFYKPTENPTLKNYQFRATSQTENETFTAFCNSVMKEAKHCNFNCESQTCTAEEIAIRDQIVIGTREQSIREEALKKSWDLKTLRKEGMQMESAARGGAEMAGEAINKLGRYSYSNIKKNRTTEKGPPQNQNRKPITCYNCGYSVSGSILRHREQCPAKSSKCNKCGKFGHFAKVCKSSKDLRSLKDQDEENKYKEQSDEEEAYNINIFRIKTSEHSVKPKMSSHIPNKQDFKVQVVINNTLDVVVADTGARISVCGTAQARKWGLLDKMTKSKKKIKPYNSTPITVHGEARCAVSFGESSIPVIWHIISGSCEPFLDGSSALQLGIIQFSSKPQVFEPVLMIDHQA